MVYDGTHKVCIICYVLYVIRCSLMHDVRGDVLGYSVGVALYGNLGVGLGVVLCYVIGCVVGYTMCDVLGVALSITKCVCTVMY